MAIVLKLLAAAALAATGAADTPLTLDELFQTPIDTAAARLFGAAHPGFVERSPWNDIEGNYVLGTVSLFGMSFYSRADHVNASVCAVLWGHAVLDTTADLVAGPTGSMPIGQRPLVLKGADIQRIYFAAGPALPVPTVPGAAPVAPPEALEVGSCANPVAARKTFAAPSDEVAIELIDTLRLAIAAADKIRIACEKDGERCGNPRRELASLSPQSTWQATVGNCYTIKNAEKCYSYAIEPNYRPGLAAESWDVEIGLDSGRRITNVAMDMSAPPVI